MKYTFIGGPVHGGSFDVPDDTPDAFIVEPVVNGRAMGIFLYFKYPYFVAPDKPLIPFYAFQQMPFEEIMAHARVLVDPKFQKC